MTDDLAALIEKAKAWWDNATQEERDAMLKAQRESWVRGEMSFGAEGTRLKKARKPDDE